MARDLTVPTTLATAERTRLASLDTMRGLIIVLMAIDHARGFIAKNHPGEFWGSSSPDYGGDWLAFVTRLVTHLCAPGFFFLMGAGMTLFGASRARAGWARGRVVRHFVLRGVTLIVLGQLLENGGVLFGFAGATRLESYGLRPPGADGTLPFIMLPVLYGLGSALVLAAPLVRLPPWLLVVGAAACLLATHLIMPPASQAMVQVHPLLRVLFIPGQTGPLMAIYPTIPWLTPVLLGAVFGIGIERDRSRAFARLALVGAAFLALFVALRASGGFGSLVPPEPGWIGFLNVVKYPPSFTFLLLTLGVNFLILAALERSHGGQAPWTGPLRVFGAVPFFFFITHLWLYAAMGRFFPAGTTIPQMYPFWLLGLLLLYVPCKWYGELKRGRAAESFLRFL